MTTDLYSVDPGDGGAYARWRGSLPELQEIGDLDNLPIPGPYDKLVIEDQVIIPRFTKRPKDIITLAHEAGAIARDFGFPRDKTRVTWVQPRSWKGGTKKPTAAKNWKAYVIHRLVEQALSQHELALYWLALARRPEGSRHDIADAVGIGLWHLGRLYNPVPVALP